METGTKRIVAIALIAVIVVAVSIVAVVLISAPESKIKYPGAPSSRPNTIVIGFTGDLGEIQGDGNYEGGYFAAKTINEAGGFEVGGETYYVGVAKEDTDESNPNLVTSRGVDAARRLIYDREVDFGIGGFRSEALLAYVEEFMDAEMIFIDTGASTDIFCQNVRDDYANYRWFFRFMPINSTSLGGQIFNTLGAFLPHLDQDYPNHDILQVGILAEDLTWTAGLVAGISYYLPIIANLTSLGYYGVEMDLDMLTPILYDITLSATDMNTHLQTLQTQGADFVIPLISAQGGVLMMQQYSQYEYDYAIFGIDVQSQLDAFWGLSGESAAYEVVMQTLERTAKTPLSIPFWDAFIDYYGKSPLYTAVGAYDAVNGLVDAIEAADSLDNDDIIAELESWDKSNPHQGVGGNAAWWPDSHDLVAGYPYGHTMWVQWQTDGTKVVIPTSIYPDALSTGDFMLPPWVETAWA